jgi:hypothetical protein
MAEQWPFKPLVAGSIPAALTTDHPGFHETQGAFYSVTANGSGSLPASTSSKIRNSISSVIAPE